MIKPFPQVKQIHIQLCRAIAELEDLEKKKAYDIGLAESLGLPIPSYLEDEQTASWQKYFKRKAKYTSQPYISFKIVEKEAPCTLGRKIEYSSMIEVIEPQTGEIIAKDKIRYKRLIEFKKRASASMDILGHQCLNRILYIENNLKNK